MLSNYTTIDNFKQEVLRRENAKKDYISPTGRIRMNSDGESIELEDVGNFNVLPNFHSQLHTHIGIPSKYYNAMQAIPGLRAHNVNAWLREQDGEDVQRLVRTLDNDARAYMSNKFRPFDNAFALKAAAPIFDEFKSTGLEVKSYNLTDNHMFLQLVFPSITGEVVPGDVMQQGITLKNSEVGRGALEVQSLLWRLVCSNGMIGESILSRRHIGSRIDFGSENAEVYEHDTIEAELESYRLRMRDVIRHAISETSFIKRIEDLREANEDTISKKKSKKVIQEVSKKFSFSEEDMDGIFTNLASDGNFSRYGVANAVTAMSHEEDNPDRAYEFETIGSKIITLSSKDWKVMVDAA